ncbi:MAG: Transcriptional regulator, AbiEi antitoxin, partial [Acidimicrobiaceae bacterium]
MVSKDAERQHGVFTLDQAREHGATPASVKHRLQTGAWRAFPYVGVYRAAGCPPSWEQDL